MPDSLQDSPTGELLQERYDYLEEMLGELDNIEIDEDNLSDEAKADLLDEFQQISYQGC